MKQADYCDVRSLAWASLLDATVLPARAQGLLLDYIEATREWPLARKLARHPSVSPGTLTRLARTGRARVLLDVLARPDCPSAVLCLAAEDRRPSIRRAAAATRLPGSRARSLAASSDIAVLRALARNEHVNTRDRVSAIEKLLSEGDEVRVADIANLAYLDGWAATRLGSLELSALPLAFVAQLLPPQGDLGSRLVAHLEKETARVTAVSSRLTVVRLLVVHALVDAIYCVTTSADVVAEEAVGVLARSAASTTTAALSQEFTGMQWKLSLARPVAPSSAAVSLRKARNPIDFSSAAAELTQLRTVPLLALQAAVESSYSNAAIFRDILDRLPASAASRAYLSVNAKTPASFVASLLARQQWLPLDKTLAHCADPPEVIRELLAINARTLDADDSVFMSPELACSAPVPVVLQSSSRTRSWAWDLAARELGHKPEHWYTFVQLLTDFEGSWLDAVAAAKTL